ncbi:hypothetical protein M3N64_05980 [Sporolactobacillus sp. CPB3-1]|uniref:CcmD family protein n=1 Tax=Sporolactobacillus mangiferae TaxID=2940498 RepID=A0ABT0M9E4_9BACL|nr:hypothetical protein [Sporolactobacillus mangiferae]MCL1631497.1 hypothetical protein [Sporolactobacillus mangiferae]
MNWSMYVPFFTMILFWFALIAVIYMLIKRLIRFTIQEIKRELKNTQE